MSTRLVARLPIAACALALALALAPSARAQSGEPPPGGPAPPSAVQRGRLGLEKFEKGEFAESFRLFSEAEALKHSPVFVLYTARSALHLGRLLEARALFRKTAAETVPPDASASWVQAQADAKGELAALEPRIPTVQARIDGPADGVTLTVDGKPLAANTWVEHDPGTVVIRATHPERAAVEKSVVLREGERDVIVSIAFDGRAKAAPPAGEETDTGGTYLPGAIVLGVGGAALVVGAVTGIVTISDADDALSPCKGDVCPRTQQDAVESASTTGNVSTVAFIAGGALVATGVVLLLVLGGDDEAEAQAAAMSKHVVVSPFWTGASGSF